MRWVWHSYCIGVKQKRGETRERTRKGPRACCLAGAEAQLEETPTVNPPNERVAALEFGPPRLHRGLALVPLFAPDMPGVDFATLDEALAESSVEAAE